MFRKLLQGVVFFNSMNLILNRDPNYYEFAGSSPESFRNRQQRYIDVYTNYPNPETILKNFQSYKDQKYVYPKSNIRPGAYSNYYNSQKETGDLEGQSTNRGYQSLPETNDDYVKFNSDIISKSDVLTSDYGDFENNFDDYFGGVVKNKTSEGDARFFVQGRPKFKTGKKYSDESHVDFYDQDYFTNIQKIPRYDEFNKSKNEKDNISSKIHDLLKKYLTRLYKKSYLQGSGDDDKEEALDVSSDFEDNIETLDDSKEVPFESGNLYEVIDEETHNKLNNTKGKFLDPSKLIILKNSTKILANKFLSLFTIIKFPNTPCVGSDGVNTYDGTCYYLTECQGLNGTPMGTCASGYGVCCVFVGTCGGSSGQNCTYFQSPNYPNYYPSNGSVVPPPPTQGPNGTIDPRLRYQLMMFLARQESTTNSLSCTFQVIKASSSIRQLRVDFLDLELRGPTNGSCINERLVITGQNLNDIIPVLCGYNSGQHIYIDVTDVPGPILFSILSTAVERKRFRLRICQIAACTTPLNCLQYYTGAQGVITSFNYDQASSLSRSVPGYFNNLNYAICIRKEAGYCSITYMNTWNGTAYPFQIVNIDDAGLSTVPPGQAGAEIFSCPEDYIVINGIRLCGERLNDGSVIQDFTRNAPVTDTGAGPIVVPVRTDGSFTGRGFRLFYTQNRCPNFFF